MYRHIIAAVDGSAHADKALLQAGLLAEASQAELTLVYINNLQDLARIDMESHALPVMLERTQHRGRAILEQAKQHLEDQHIVIDCQMHLGESWLGKRDMVSMLVKFAAAHDTDLIVIGTHGRSGLLNLLMGSFIENLMRLTPCPLLIVRGQPHTTDA